MKERETVEESETTFLHTRSKMTRKRERESWFGEIKGIGNGSRGRSSSILNSSRRDFYKYILENFLLLLIIYIYIYIGFIEILSRETKYECTNILFLQEEGTLSARHKSFSMIPLRSSRSKL